MKESVRDYAVDDLFQFDKLKLVEKPNDEKNASSLPQNLKDCEGYLFKLPLKKPNVDQKNPKTIVDMINVLTNPEACAMFENELLKEDEQEVREGLPSHIYDYTNAMMKKQLKIQATSHMKAASIFGHIVDPGCISLYKRDGKTFAVGEGRWLLTSPKAAWFRKNIRLDQDLIQAEDAKSKLLIIRVLPGEVGLVREQGREVLLDVGTHVFNSGTVSNFHKKTYSKVNYFNHGRYQYLRVPRGMIAKVWVEVKGDGGVKSVSPRLLAQGEHFCDSHLFKFDGLVSLSDEYIAHGSIHRISVPKDSVAKVVHDNKPRLLGEGDHLIESPQFKFTGFESIIGNSCIVHGTVTIVRVSLGQIALAWMNNDPVFIDVPGLYEYDSPDFHFVEFKDAEERLIQLGAKKVVIVHTGQVGVTYDEGLLKILKDGRHIINSSTHIFHRFLSTQQKSIRLATLPESEKISRSSKRKSKKASANHERDFVATSASDPDADLTICETKDLVKVGLRADVFYSIEDPEKCINKIDTDELEDLVRETAVATLTNIIRSTALNEIAQSKQVSAGGSGGDVTIMPPPTVSGNESPSMFFEKAHDEFLLKLHDDFMQRYGVDIANIRIESFKIIDSELSDQISKHALTTAQIENEMANLEGKSLISTTEERTAAEVKNISAEAEAASLKTTADAANQRKIDAASAEAEALKIAARAKAEADAEAIKLKAMAEAEAIKLKACAEAERAEMLSKTGLGKQEALLSIYSDMVVKSNEGVEKIVYLDPTVSRESPFALSSLNNLNQDLHSLTQLGIAAGEVNGGKKKDQ